MEKNGEGKTNVSGKIGACLQNCKTRDLTCRNTHAFVSNNLVLVPKGSLKIKHCSSVHSVIFWHPSTSAAAWARRWFQICAFVGHYTVKSLQCNSACLGEQVHYDMLDEARTVEFPGILSSSWIFSDLWTWLILILADACECVHGFWAPLSLFSQYFR